MIATGNLLASSIITDNRGDIYRSLMACSRGEKCDECAYDCFGVDSCVDNLMFDAAAALRAGMEHEDRLDERIKLMEMQVTKNGRNPEVS